MNLDSSNGMQNLALAVALNAANPKAKVACFSDALTRQFRMQHAKCTTGSQCSVLHASPGRTLQSRFQQSHDCRAAVWEAVRPCRGRWERLRSLRDGVSGICQH